MCSSDFCNPDASIEIAAAKELAVGDVFSSGIDVVRGSDVITYFSSSIISFSV